MASLSLESKKRPLPDQYPAQTVARGARASIDGALVDRRLISASRGRIGARESHLLERLSVIGNRSEAEFEQTLDVFGAMDAGRWIHVVTPILQGVRQQGHLDGKAAYCGFALGPNKARDRAIQNGILRISDDGRAQASRVIEQQLRRPRRHAVCLPDPTFHRARSRTVTNIRSPYPYGTAGAVGRITDRR